MIVIRESFITDISAVDVLRAITMSRGSISLEELCLSDKRWIDLIRNKSVGMSQFDVIELHN